MNSFKENRKYKNRSSVHRYDCEKTWFLTLFILKINLISLWSLSIAMKVTNNLTH